MTILDEIVEHKRREVAQAAAAMPLAEMRRHGEVPRERRSLWHALDVDAVVVIAEIKRASPTAGVFAEDLDPAAQAAEYASSGAAAISVLTDQNYFRGSLSDLEQARGACELPETGNPTSLRITALSTPSESRTLRSTRSPRASNNL